MKRATVIPLLGLVLVFSAPMFAAWLCHQAPKPIFKPRSHGNLLSPVTEALADSIGTRWQVVYVMPHNCDNNCQQQLQKLSKLPILLRSDAERVELKTKHNKELLINVEAESVLILDPENRAILHYPPNTNPKYTLKDLQKLLRYSNAN